MAHLIYMSQERGSPETALGPGVTGDADVSDFEALFVILVNGTGVFTGENWPNGRGLRQIHDHGSCREGTVR